MQINLQFIIRLPVISVIHLYMVNIYRREWGIAFNTWGHLPVYTSTGSIRTTASTM